jgi:hypothetical protein
MAEKNKCLNMIYRERANIGRLKIFKIIEFIER